MIKDERRDAGIGEPLGERAEPIAARPGQAVAITISATMPS